MNARVLGVVLVLLATSSRGDARRHDVAEDRHRGQENAAHFTNEWVVRLQGGPQVAQLMAVEMGYVYRGPVRGFADTYRLTKVDHPQVHKRGFPRLTQRLTNDARVVWAEQQFAKERTKRSVLPVGLNRRKRRDLSVPSSEDRYLFNDELWDQEWYLQDTRTRLDLPKLDLHVLPLYAMGVTGRGVRVSVLDDGIEHQHDDLRTNYDAEISFDANDDDDDPTPRYDAIRSNAHGTRCAGEIAMAANNHKCGVGVAYNARIGGVRLLDGVVNDAVEGTALGHAYDKVDIYSASWGPTDDGQTVEGPGRLATEAILRGINKGRGGKGVIFVWASGNGGMREDNCNCDGYIASVYTLAIGSASQQGQFPWYGERCAATFATTYSSGAYYDQMIATTDLKNTCTIKHTGTSAAAPLAAGIIALALEINPNLSWRDVQHLVMWTSEFEPLSDNKGWQRNAAGMWVNIRFGFGLMNAYGLVTAAANWTSVPPKSTCVVPSQPLASNILAQGSTLKVKFSSLRCKKEINFLEHVEVLTNVLYPIRGHLEIFLTSPEGSRVQLLSPRKFDNSSDGFVNWKFMSVLTWGENPAGIWRLEIVDETGEAGTVGSVGRFELILHGTKDQPAYRARGPRTYNEDYNRIHKKTAGESESVSGDYSGEPVPLSEVVKRTWGPPDDRVNLDGLKTAVRELEDRETKKSWLHQRLFGTNWNG